MLRPWGRLVFLGNHPMLHACAPENGANIGRELVRPYYGMHTLAASPPPRRRRDQGRNAPRPILPRPFAP